MRVGIIGAGSWGSALARVAALRGHEVCLWAYESEVVDSIRHHHRNDLFLPGIDLPARIAVTGELRHAAREAEMLITAVPSQYQRKVIEDMADWVSPDALLVSAGKGIEENTLLRMSEVIEQAMERRFPPKVVALSGPTFAREVAEGRPTALVAAARRLSLAKRVQTELSSLSFRIYRSGDLVGVELGGAVKNVIAIAAGVCAGLGLGHNALAAVITRGLAEISRLAGSLGGKRRTLAGLAGMGDLVLTCTGVLSRNRTVGCEIGRGRRLADVLGSMRMVAEGVPTTRATVRLARRNRVEMPITFQMDRLLREEIGAAQAIEELMSRPLRRE